MKKSLKEFKLIVILGIIFSIIIIKGLNSKLIMDILTNFIFAFLVILISRKIELNNRYLNWCGKNLFPLYIYMRVPMLVLDNLLDLNVYMFFVVSLIGTIMITLMYNFLIKRISMSYRRI